MKDFAVSEEKPEDAMGERKELGHGDRRQSEDASSEESE